MLHSNTTSQENSTCRYCDSKNLDYSKYFYWGKRAKTYHYGIRCLDCKNVYKVERNKFVYERVKDKSWIYSKNALKKLQKLRLLKGA